MAQSSVCCSLCQNYYDGKDKLAAKMPTKSSNRCTPAPAATRALTPAAAPVVVPLVAFRFANSSMVRYLEDNLQRIVRTIFEARPLLSLAPAPVPAPVVAAALHYEGLRERPLKAWFLDIYWNKTHLECYNFF